MILEIDSSQRTISVTSHNQYGTGPYTYQKRLVNKPFEAVLKRFWSKVDKSGKNGCWIWLGSRHDNHGYGTMCVNGKSILAHRLALLLAGMDIPKGMFVCHHCDNPSCVNPDHLFIGTNADNIADMMRKGRAKHPVGSGCGSSKLTDDLVRHIRSVCENRTMTQRVLAKTLGVSNATIERVRAGKTWKHVV